MAYNYAHFDTYVSSGEDAVEFGAFPDHLHVGDQAPDGTVTRLDDGRPVVLSERWRRRMLVMEFGSFT